MNLNTCMFPYLENIKAIKNGFLETGSNLLLRCVPGCVYPLGQNHMFANPYFLETFSQSSLRVCLLGHSHQRDTE